MGYYSFYRIIKDIIRNFKKNKLLVIIAIIILLLFLCNKVFASDNNIYSFTTGGTTYYLNFNNKVGTCKGTTDKFFTNPDIWNYNILIISNGSYIDFLLYNGDLTYKLDTNINRYGFYSNTSSYIHVGESVGAGWVWAYPQSLSDFSILAPNTAFRGYNYSATYDNIMFSSTNIYDENGKIFYKSSLINYPKITNKLEDLQTLNFDTISVSAWDWSNKDLYILFYDRTLMNNQNTEGLYPKKEIKLTKDTSYYIPEISSEENAIYWVANDNTGLNFKVGGKYEIRLAERVPQSTGRRFSWWRFV